jgi:hypothetical protein
MHLMLSAFLVMPACPQPRFHAVFSRSDAMGLRNPNAHCDSYERLDALRSAAAHCASRN